MQPSKESSGSISVLKVGYEPKYYNRWQFIGILQIFFPGQCSIVATLGLGLIIITKTMFMVLSSWQSHCESSPGSFDECRTVPSGRRPKTKPDDL